jgi:hypothetical protein
MHGALVDQLHRKYCTKQLGRNGRKALTSKTLATAKVPAIPRTSAEGRTPVAARTTTDELKKAGQL